MSYLRLSSVVKTFNDVRVVKQLSLDIKEGELMSFLGPSGCGKTTTLNMIAGFIDVDGGSIEVDGSVVHHLPPYKRNMGMVFQNYALFPHMTVFDNIAFGLKLRKVARNDIQRRVQKVLEMTKLQNLKDRYPRELSGGQQQRVAISRALVIQPTVLLLDEPLSNLDAKLRQEMREEIIEIQKNVGITTIFVTHDQEEALAISDRIAVMNDGLIEQVDTPENIYNQPRTAFVAGFIGEVNKLPAQLISSSPTTCTVEVFGNLIQLNSAINCHDNKDVQLYIRPEKIRMSKVKPHTTPSVLATLQRKVFLGSKTRYVLRVNENQIIAEIPNSDMHHSDLLDNTSVHVYWNSEDLLVSGNEV